MIRIFKADATHLHQLIALSKQTFSDAFEHMTDPAAYEEYTSKAFAEETMREELAHAEQHFYIADIDGVWAGYLKVRHDRPHESFGETPVIEMQRLYILESFWGHKVGAALMQFCIDLARGTGSEWIWLVVWYQNHTAIRFYERWGFEAFAYFDFKFGHEIHRDHVMRLRVLPTE